MKNQKLLNAEIIREIAAVGHTQSIVVCDAGLPVPRGVKVIDLALVKGIPTFVDVLEAICSELVVESYIYAAEADEVNSRIVGAMQCCLSGLTATVVPHERLKEMSKEANVIIRTGECSSYANVILVAGVNF